MTGRAQALVLAVLLAVSFSAGWWVNAQRAEARMSLLKKEHVTQEKQALEASLASYSRMEKTKDEAIKSAQARADHLQADAGAAAAAADSLRKQLAGVPARISAASRAAVDEYAATAGELLSACTEEYQWMARQADGHANDARMITESWPR
jgi:chromosome segregation ATPase